MDTPGLYRDVVALLKSPVELCQQHASGVIMALTAEKSYQSRLLEEGLLDLLVGILGVPNMVMKVQATAAFWSLCDDNQRSSEQVRWAQLYCLWVFEVRFLGAVCQQRRSSYSYRPHSRH